MAHKHNRRRVRPRSRQYKHSGYENNFSYDTLSVAPQIMQTRFYRPTVDAPLYSSPIASRISGIQQHDDIRSGVNSTRRFAQVNHLVNSEMERIKVFGGEIGDDIALCSKMMEVFEGMDWINT